MIDSNETAATTPAAGETAAPAATQAGSPTGSGAPNAVAGDVSQGVNAPEEGAPKISDQTPADDWPAQRLKWAGDDQKKLDRISRYPSREAALDALIATQDKIRSGEFRKPLPSDPTPEELHEYRQSHGIPAAPDKYDLAEIGIEAKPEDSAGLKQFLEVAHGANMTPGMLKATVAWVMDRAKEEAAAREDAIGVAKAQAEDVLRVRWGSDYRVNENSIANLLSLAPEGVAEKILGAADKDGIPLAYRPEVKEWLAGIARELNPVSTIIPANGAATVSDELSALTKMAGNLNSEYWVGPKAQEMQKRREALIRATRPR